ncbi:hypothetical protein [Amycolatopsis suaedae]|uniref:Uncharacterized protein n=1 Tax=Amycolatopsis suaedae TaxID=2510978 RepID=A0A4V2ELF7_9PSEU|nr:hypothetical protein [Amycolatopsis suaedae]RZQ61405.1 hypothetical protein EWH70_23785 [Amycolatopsis suaedae]
MVKMLTRTLAAGLAAGAAGVVLAAPAGASSEPACLNTGFFEIEYNLEVAGPGAGGERVRVWPGTRGAILTWDAVNAHFAIESGPTAGLKGWGPTEIFTIDNQGTC